MANNSSIFNFDSLRAAAKLPLRAHAWHALLLIGAVTIIATASLKIPYTPRSEHRVKDLTHLADAEVMILGNSQIAGVDERAIVFPALSFAQGGTGIRAHNALLHEMAPRMPKLRTVLLGFDNISLRVRDIEDRKSDFRDLAALGIPWYEVPARWRDRVRFAVRNSASLRNIFYGERPALQDLVHWPILSKAEAATDSNAPKSLPAEENVFTVKRGYVLAPVQGQGKMTSYLHSLQDAATYRKGKTAFFDILTYCAAHDLNVALVRTPTTPAFSGTRSAAWDTELIELLNEARTRFPDLPLPVWDAERALGVPLEKFMDPNHLNHDGLAVFTSYLNARLMQSPFPDDSPSLFAFKYENLLATEDPREDAWRGLRNKAGRIDRATIPPQLATLTKSAFRVTLHPGEEIYCAGGALVSPGDTYSAEVWLWADQYTEGSALHVLLARHGQGTFSAATAIVTYLPPVPQKVSLNQTFTADFEAARLQIANKSSADITFYLAAPRLRLEGRASASP